MRRKADERIDFVDFRAGDIGQRVFLTIDDLLLQGDIEFGKGDLHGGRAQRLEDVDRCRVGRGAEFESLQVIRCLDDALAVGDVADAVVPVADGNQPQRLEFRFQQIANLAGKQFDAISAVGEQEGQAQRGKFGNHRRDRALAIGRNAEGAGAQAGQHGGIVTELCGAGDGNFQCTAGFGLDQFGEFVGSDRARIACCCAVPESDLHRGGPENRRCAGDGDDTGHAGTLDERTTSHFEAVFHFPTLLVLEATRPTGRKISLQPLWQRDWKLLME